MLKNHALFTLAALLVVGSAALAGAKPAPSTVSAVAGAAVFEPLSSAVDRNRDFPSSESQEPLPLASTSAGDAAANKTSPIVKAPAQRPNLLKPVFESVLRATQTGISSMDKQPRQKTAVHTADGSKPQVYAKTLSAIKTHRHNVQTAAPSRTRPVAASTIPSTTGLISSSNQDLYWLSRLVEAEAGAESMNVKLAVADVVLNRTASPDYPNTVKGVIFQVAYGHYAFTSVANGWIYHTPSADSITAAKMALYGHKNIVPSALVFYNSQQTPAQSWVRTQPVLTVLGHMTFAQ
ncbi:cell wall hydrolase [Alicyclobacillus tolerans]|uniref:cell wall hydrolase n=1 Tax=Alicyclobacillus tolerans TaxID=90970 RepID=UPI001F3D6017|nr:cell wall hydrolase [Alicyclobacillus tolerans]MCF8565787.1 cell wall hydrolase [Alicyclobacillus tolerans]